MHPSSSINSRHWEDDSEEEDSRQEDPDQPGAPPVAVRRPPQLRRHRSIVINSSHTQRQQPQQQQQQQQQHRLGHVSTPAYYTSAADNTAQPSPSPSPSSSSQLSLSLPSSSPSTSTPTRSLSSASTRTPTRSSSRSSFRPPPLTLAHSTITSAATIAAFSPSPPAYYTASSPPPCLLVLDDPETQRVEERIVHITTKSHSTSRPLHNVSLVGYLVHQLLAIAVVVLASLWRDWWGVAWGCGCFVLGVVGSMVWWYGLLMRQRVWVTHLIRPLVLVVRLALLTLLVVLVLTHSLHPDAAWAPYPLSCPSSPLSCARVGANSTRVSALQPPMFYSTMSTLRAGLLQYVAEQEGWVILDSNMYDDNSDSSAAPSDSVLIRVRALSTVLSLPHDITIRIFCNNAYHAAVWVQSAGRVSSLPNYGVDTRHVDDIVQYLRGTEWDAQPCQQSATVNDIGG